MLQDTLNKKLHVYNLQEKRMHLERCCVCVALHIPRCPSALSNQQYKFYFKKLGREEKIKSIYLHTVLGDLKKISYHELQVKNP